MFRTGDFAQDVMRCDGTYFGSPDTGEAPMAPAFLRPKSSSYVQS